MSEAPEVTAARQARVEDSGARLVKQLAPQKRRGILLEKGEVKSIQTDPARLTVEWNSEEVDTPRVRYLASYIPSVGDIVIGVSVGPEAPFVLGTLA